MKKEEMVALQTKLVNRQLLVVTIGVSCVIWCAGVLISVLSPNTNDSFGFYAIGLFMLIIGFVNYRELERSIEPYLPIDTDE